MTTAFSPAVDRHIVAAFSETPVGFIVPGQQKFLSSCPRTLPTSGFDCKNQRYPPFKETLNCHPMDMVHPSAYGEYTVVDEKAGLDAGMGLASGGSEAAPYRQKVDFLPSLYGSVLPPPPEPSDPQHMTPSPYTRESFRQSKDDSGVFTDVRSAAETPGEMPSEPSGTKGRQPHYTQDAYDVGRPASSALPTTPRHPSISLAAAGTGVSPRRDSQYAPIIPSSAGPSYKPSAIPISSNTRAVAQQPTYITPPSSPTPIVVNPVYTFTNSPYAAEANRASQARAPVETYAEQPYQPMGFNAPEGKEICVECAMRDQDMADVDVTGPGVWERESDVYYKDLCRQEIEEAEERVRARASNSSSESHAVLRPGDPGRPRAKGNRLTEPNLKLWMSMNPREPQARQQTIDLYIKTQTALLEAEALARARALQESRLLESKLRDTYDNLRRSTYEFAPGGLSGDEGGVRPKPSHTSKRSVSGPTPISLGPIIVDGVTHIRHQSQSREVTLLENGMIVEHVDVRKEEKERRREEKRERERERSRARKSSRGSGRAEVMSMYSAHSPLPHQTDSGFYTAASNGSGMLRGERPMSLSQASTRALSAQIPLTGSPGFGPARPPNARVHSQISLVDSQSISSTSFSANRRSRFFSFKNWSEAWKSRESFAPSAVISLSGSMMDMHLALDREKQSMHMRPTTVDLGSNAPSIRPSGQWPRRASMSMDRMGTPTEGDRPKKKKGLAKIWGIVTGHRSAKTGILTRGESHSVDRSEDDMPLAPPPPLSYLVNRTSRERTMSTATHRTSMPSVIIPPPTSTPSGALPTPTSIRNPWQEHDSAWPSSHVLPVHAEETSNNGFAVVDPQPDQDKRPRTQDTMQQMSPRMRMPSSPRPISVYSLHKSLPPLPVEVSSSQPMLTPVDSPRPKTMYDMDSPTGPDTLKTPQPAFHRDVRRQSFGGMSSRPDVTSASTLPVNGRNGGRSGFATPQESYAAYSPYAEMGMAVAPASRSLIRLGPSADDGSEKSERVIGKRRSKFGLASLLGKVTSAGRASEARLSLAATPSRDGEMPQSESDIHVDGSPAPTDHGTIGNGNGSGSSRSRHGGYAPPLRMSVASRRAIEELVDQDPNFVAYRYPVACLRVHANAGDNPNTINFLGAARTLPSPARFQDTRQKMSSKQEQEPTVVSASGKVLLAGGYLVLDQKYSGTVVSTSSRFLYYHSIWDIRNASKNKFVYIALQQTLRLVCEIKGATHITNSLENGLDITIAGANDFYSQRAKLAKLGLEPRIASLAQIPPFAHTGVQLKDVHKTGLGSSAALITSLVAALLLHLDAIPSTSLDTLDTVGRALIHNTAQFVHCLAQGKVGSGFDVAAATFGSHRYTRFDPRVLSDLMDTDASAAKPLLPVLDPTNKAWDHTVAPFQLPPGTRLMLADVDAGSDTPSLVGKVLKWHKSAGAEATAFWDALSASNDALTNALMRLSDLHAQGAEVYQATLARLAGLPASEWSACPSDPVTGALVDARKWAEDIRTKMREMGVRAGVPIEPSEQTALLDACVAQAGVVAGGVPGDPSSPDAEQDAPLGRVERVWAGWTALDVSPLSAAESFEKGLRRERIQDVLGLTEALGSAYY
ncbi:hypothetical protein EW145_g3017 [Phellinidium pouzarii]|uniref:phosphomevalonate kinase n=1 Tax=Phellinidium pouzarii TaxID=167371 RepID=A0A4S4L8X6_9AGAM|nr:hypothetical protein EW145_g3017 [Phellinidium pouzarii]